jgi:hypothetical protein
MSTTYAACRLGWAFMPCLSCLEEGEQVGVDDFGLRCNHAVRIVLVGFKVPFFRSFAISSWA